MRDSLSMAVVNDYSRSREIPIDLSGPDGCSNFRIDCVTALSKE